MPPYNTRVETYRIDPPVAGNEWGAKAHVQEIGAGDGAAVSLSEHWGETKDEAKAKAAAEAQAWIAERGGDEP